MEATLELKGFYKKSCKGHISVEWVVQWLYTKAYKEPQGLNFTQMLQKSLGRLFLLKLKTDFLEFFWLKYGLIYKLLKMLYRTYLYVDSK